MVYLHELYNAEFIRKSFARIKGHMRVEKSDKTALFRKKRFYIYLKILESYFQV